VLDRRFGPGTLTAVVDDALDALGEGSGLAALLHSRAAQRAKEDKDAPQSLLPLDDMRRAVFASLVNLLAQRLPADEAKLAEIMKRHDDVALDAIAESMLAAEQAIAGYLQRALDYSAGRIGLLARSPVKTRLSTNRKRLDAAIAAAQSRPKPQRPTPGNTGTVKPRGDKAKAGKSQRGGKG
jgi:hypothetical protein